MKPGEKLSPMKGIEIWKNPKNGFVVCQIHYSADPAKTPGYMKSVRESLPIRKFMQEYELQWETYEGLPVYADWNKEVHGTSDEIKPHIGLPLLIGMDFGLTPALLVCQYQDKTLCVLKEFTAMNMGAKRFLTLVTPQLKVLYPLWADFRRDWIVFIDPAGFQKAQTDETTCAQVIGEAGFHTIVPGEVTWESRRQSVEHYLTTRTNEGPGLKISLPNCPILVRGFSGGYRYPDSALDKEPNKLRPLKDIHSHVHDALQMVTSKLTTTKRRAKIQAPARPSYSFVRASGD